MTPVSRALSFGGAAAAYERYRPGYPPEVADLLVRGLGEPARLRGLEVGAGTGKATRLVAGRGVAVTAVEPDPDMRMLLSFSIIELPVTVVAATLETLPEAVTATPYDVVWAAAAFHWTDPAARWERVAMLLRPGGVVGCFGGPVDLMDDGLRERVSRLREEVLPTDEVPPEAVGEQEGALRWPGTEWERHPAFDEVEQHDLTSEATMSGDDLVGLLSTVSAYLVLPVDQRVALLRRIRGALPDEVAVRRSLTLHRAVRT